MNLLPSMPRKLLLLEFNELCPSLLQRWMASGHLPNFRRFHDQSQVYLTFPDADPPALEPWIQWYSIHTGLSFTQHRVFRLTEGSQSNHRDIWTVLQNSGLRTANCASINSRPSVAPDCFFLPDPWSDARPIPEEVERFHRFITLNVREHTRPSADWRWGDAWDFMSFLAGHGLRSRTIARVLMQLCHETVARRDVRWKRVALLDMLQLDLFAYYFSRLKPHFSTFFLNSTAHLQHAYWRHMDPGAFQARLDQQERDTYQNAVLYGYKCMDSLLRVCFALAQQENVTLALATGLGQQPFLTYEKAGGQRFYRPRDIDRLLNLLTVRPDSIASVMAHEYVLRFAGLEEQARAAQILSDVTCNGESVFDVHSEGGRQIYLGSRLHTPVPENAWLYLGDQGTHRHRFHDIFYLIDEKKSGCHHPEGLLWIRTGVPTIHSHKISILDVFPTVLDFFGIDDSPRRVHRYQGQSRVSEWRSA